MIDWLERCSGEKKKSDLKKELTTLRRKRINYLKSNKKGNQSDEYHHYLTEEINEESEEDDNNKGYFDLVALRNHVINKSHRGSVSAEAYGKFNPWKPTLNLPSKCQCYTSEQMNIIKSIAKQNIMLATLDPKDFEHVFNSMKINQYSIGDIVIKEGEEGNHFYVVQSGTLDCFKNGLLMTTYESGDSFGELALLYNTPRQATIISKSSSILLNLDRESFTSIVKNKAIARKIKNEQFLSSISILKNFSKKELSQIAEALKIKKYLEGEYIIHQDEEGDTFYILEEGQVYATKNDDRTKIIKQYYPGDYFGELALIKNNKRVANIIAKTNCSVLALERKPFKRLLGSIENILYIKSNEY